MSMSKLREASGGGRQVSPAANLQNFLSQYKTQIEAALPKHLNADRMIRLAMTAFSQNKSLQDCSVQSIFGSVVLASQMGLEIGVAGQGYMVPYKGKATFVPGWQGIVDIVARSGRASVWTGAVRAGDKFSYTYGVKPNIDHVPADDDEEERPLTHVYAVGWVRDALYPIIEVWSMNKIWRHRDRFNKVGAQHYSYAHPEMYARKIPLLQVCKYMPKSIELSMAQDASEGGIVLDGQFTTVDEDDATPNVTEKGDGATKAIDAPKPDLDVLAQIQAARSADELDAAADLIRSLPQDQQKAARDASTAKRKELDTPREG